MLGRLMSRAARSVAYEVFQYLFVLLSFAFTLWVVLDTMR